MVSRPLSGAATFLVFMLAYSVAVAQTAPSTTGPTSNTQATDFHTPNTLDPSSPPLLQERHSRYQVMPKDVLAVTFPLSAELNQTVTVQPDGFINLANVGSIYVQGQTCPEIVETLKRTYAHTLHDPIIAVDVTNFQGARFTIFGQVLKPGEYELRYDATVSQAIAIGGGLLPSAKNQAFLLRRVSSDLLEVKKLNIKDFVHGKNVSEDIHLQTGDMVYVPETVVAKFRRYLPYSTGIGVSPLAVAQSINP